MLLGHRLKPGIGREEHKLGLAYRTVSVLAYDYVHLFPVGRIRFAVIILLVL